MLEAFCKWICINFGLFMFILASLLMIIHRLVDRKIPPFEVLYRWFALLPVGFTSIYAFIMHAFFPVFTAESIGWANSPFQYEVAMADLSFGVLAILSFKASYGFRLATVLGITCWLWGDAVGHIYQINVNHNFNSGNAGSWLYMDMFLPVILLLAIVKLKPIHKSKH